MQAYGKGGRRKNSKTAAKKTHGSLSIFPLRSKAKNDEDAFFFVLIGESVNFFHRARDILFFKKLAI
jgi:hypothetical protein